MLSAFFFVLCSDSDIDARFRNCLHLFSMTVCRNFFFSISFYLLSLRFGLQYLLDGKFTVNAVTRCSHSEMAATGTEKFQIWVDSRQELALFCAKI